jgi:hypothetical protein
MARNNSNNASGNTSNSSSGRSGSSSKSNRRRSGGRKTGPSRQQSRGGQQSTMRSSGGQSRREGRMQSFGTRALSAVAEHPIPVAMIGAGLAMLLLENRTGLANVERRMMRQGRELLGGVGESLSDYTSTAREALGEAAEYVGESLAPATRIGEYVSNGASTLGQGVESAYEYGRDALAETWERHPVALCASILAAGLAAGFLLPSTRRENSLFGRASDAVTRKIREQGRELVSQGRELASDAAQSVVQSVGALGIGASGATSSRGGASNSKSNRSRRSRRSND